MNPLAWLQSGLGILDKLIPDATRATEVKAKVVISALEGLGWAQKWLAMVFGCSLAAYLVLPPVIQAATGTFVPVQWWIVFLLLALTWVLLGRSIKDLRWVWDQVKKERGTK